MVPEPSDQRPFSTRLNDTIIKHLSDERFGVSELVGAMGMSHSTLRRKVKILAGTSISKYICRLRLEKAVKMLDSGSMTVSEVAFSCGFRSVSYFVRCFKKMHGSTPGRFRKEHTEQKEVKRPNDQISTIRPGNPGRKRGMMVLGVMTILLIVTIFWLFFISPSAIRDRSLEASVAVLPFRNLSPDESEMYFINGTMEAILNHLNEIEGLRVPGMTTMERYRNTPLSIQELAKELRVSYILEGSGQKSGDRVRLSVALVDAVNDRQVWSDHYDEDIHEAEEIFRLQSSVALRVAKEIRVVIRPEEAKKIKTIPTKNLSAYYFYRMGREEHDKYIFLWDILSIEKAKRYYRRSLEYDSLFAPPYCWLAYTYLHRRTYLQDLYEDPSDSALILADIALSLDDQMAEPYHIRGWYYFQAGDFTRALEECESAERLDPDDFYLHLLKAWCYWGIDVDRSAECFKIAISCADGPGIPLMYRSLGYLYMVAGFPQQSEFHFYEAFKLDRDSVALYNGLAHLAFVENNLSEAIALGMKGHAADSLDCGILEILGYSYMFNRQPDLAAAFFNRCLENQKNMLDRYYFILGPAGYSYWMTGKREQAEILFNEQIRHATRIIEKDLPSIKTESIYRIAAIHAIRGDTAKALDYLRLFSQDPYMYNYRSTMLNQDPSFDNLRNHPEFQQIRQDVNTWYQKEYAGVGSSFQ